MVVCVSQQGFQIKMAEQDMHASSPSTARKATHGGFAGPLLSTLHPRHGSGAHCFSSKGISSLTSISAQDSIYYSPLQSGKLFLGPALTGVPGGSDSRVCLQFGRAGFNPWVGKIPWRREWQPTPVLLPGKSHGWRSLAGRKESDTTEWLLFLSFFHSDRVLSPAGDDLTT